MHFDWLDIFTTILGLIYIWLEYKAHIGLWIVGIIMPALDVYLYYNHGLYGDAGMAIYYTLAAIYGYIAWKLGNQKAEMPLKISHTPVRLYLPILVFFLVAWALTYYVLITWTNSTVPVLDAFTNALSFIEQWLFWIVVDVVCTMLYVQKGIPFKAGLYGLYVIIAVFGYFKWLKLMKDD